MHVISCSYMHRLLQIYIPRCVYISGIISFCKLSNYITIQVSYFINKEFWLASKSSD